MVEGRPDDRVPCEDFATCGAAQFQNSRHAKNQKQQDSYFVVEDFGATFGINFGPGQRVALYGVADGHGEFGEICANFVRRNFPSQVAQSPHFAASRFGDALLEAFTQTELLQQSAGLPLWASGACVSAALVSSTHIVVANCGDCRCVLSVRGVAEDLSNDHNVENANPQEIRRVLNSGGTIMPDKRVTMAGAPGRLATTRSLGDYWAKPQGQPERHVISGLPEIRIVARKPGEQFLFLASDGIFGFMSSQDVVTLCMKASCQVPQSTPLSRLAHAVLCTAVNARRSDDNCTIVIVDLSRLELAAGEAGLPLKQPPEMGLPCGVRTSAHGGYPSHPDTPQNPSLSNSLTGAHPRTPLEDESEASFSSVLAPDEVCWCPWCWRQNRDGNPEHVVLGSFEKWRLHMHEQHFDKLGGAYGPDELVPCYWCCRPCVTKKGQARSANSLPFWGSHERVCRENPNKPPLLGQSRNADGCRPPPSASDSDSPKRGCRGRCGTSGGSPSSGGEYAAHPRVARTDGESPKNGYQRRFAAGDGSFISGGENYPHIRAGDKSIGVLGRTDTSSIFDSVNGSSSHSGCGGCRRHAAGHQPLIAARRDQGGRHPHHSDSAGIPSHEVVAAGAASPQRRRAL